jgi:diketogulonate reductase-like aldo/keto reductase
VPYYLTGCINIWQAGKEGEVEQVVKDAIDVGYRHIDGAMIYENEKEVGAAINAKIAEGVIKRQDIFVTSKVGIKLSLCLKSPRYPLGRWLGGSQSLY